MVTDNSPGGGDLVENADPEIFAAFSDAGGSGVDPNSIRISVDNADVTASATVSPTYVFFSPSAPLTAGAHTVHVTAADLAGNVTTKDWSFAVVSQHAVQSFRPTNTGGAIGPLTDLQYELDALPGGHAEFSVATLATDLPMIETSPGVYRGTYTVRRGDNVRAVPVVARFTAPGGGTTYVSLPTGLTLSAGRPARARILLPEEGDPIEDSADIAGRSTPGSRVRVEISYVSTAQGGALPVQGSCGAREGITGTDGIWRILGIPLRSDSVLGDDRETQFTLTATTISENGEQSEPTQIHVGHE